MKYPLKNYQRTAVDKLKSRLTLLLDEGSKGTIVFKAPTGSGKTFMISTLLKRWQKKMTLADFVLFGLVLVKVSFISNHLMLLKNI